jgi:hypothetical protein
VNHNDWFPCKFRPPFTALLEAGVSLSVVSKQAGHASTEMTEAQYGWVADELARQQIAAVETGFAKSGKTTQVVSSQKRLSPDVMKGALEYATSSGLPLAQVIAILTGQDGNLAAE